MVVPRFDICLISLDPTRGSEIRKTRLKRRLGHAPEDVQMRVIEVLQEMFAE
jgi:hypothetical protein